MQKTLGGLPYLLIVQSLAVIMPPSHDRQPWPLRCMLKRRCYTWELARGWQRCTPDYEMPYTFQE